ncbi:MAG: MATE family efflux transporter [Candidatus Spyradocola sp.]
MKDMTKGSELRALIGFSLPMLAGNLFQQLYNIADSVIVGNLLGKECLAAVGFSYQINFLLVALSTGVTLGSSVLISRYFGAKSMQQVKKVADTGFLFAAALSLCIAAAGFCLSGAILRLFNVPDDLFAYAKTYLQILFLGVIPTFAYNALSNLLRGIGDSRTPTLILIAASLLNVALDLFLIAVLHWGVAGAAIATVAAQAFSFAACALFIRRRHPDLSLRPRALQLDAAELKKSLAIGTPAMLQQVFIAVGFMSIQYLINSFGTDCMAAYTAASKVDSFAEMPAVNLGQALTNFAAQNYGAGKPKRALRGGWMGLAVGAAVSVLLSAVICIFPAPLIALFNRDPAVIAIGTGYLRIVSAFYVVFAAMHILNGLLLGYGKSLVPMLASVGSLCLLQVPVAILLSRTALAWNGIWIAAPIGWIGGLLVRLLYFLRLYRKEMAHA